VQAHAAKKPGISARSLWHRIKKLNIQINRVIRQACGLPSAPDRATMAADSGTIIACSSRLSGLSF
jgi:hypothetical protein